MSRKGRILIALPKGVDIQVARNLVTVKGPKGTLKQEIKDGIEVAVKDGSIHVTAQRNGLKAYHGLYRSLIANMVEGASKGFTRNLEMVGVGYRANVQGKFLDLQLGHSHENKMAIPEGLEIKVDKNNTVVIITGIDKQKVGQFAAAVRAVRPPEPYKGKGVRYENEYVRRKAGKAGKKAAA